MGDDPHLGALGDGSDQAGLRLQQFWTQAVLRFVWHQQGRQSRAEQSRCQQQIAQGAIRKFSGLKGPQPPRLP